MNKIKELREEKGIFQKDLAKYLNVQQNTISSWERNNSEPEIELLIKIADYFEVSIDYLVGRADEMNRVIIENEISQDEKDLVQIYRHLQTTLKFKLLGYALGLKEQQA